MDIALEAALKGMLDRLIATQGLSRYSSLLGVMDGIVIASKKQSNCDASTVLKLLSALRALGEANYVTDPVEGLAFIREFLAERAHVDGEDILEDFLCFVRPKIVRSRKMGSMLADLAKIADSPISEESPRRATTRVVWRALRALPKYERRVLGACARSRWNETHVAGEFGVARYKIRETCVRALRDVATSMGSTSDHGPEWCVVRLVWGDGRSISDAATALSLRPSEARMECQRAASVLTTGLESAATD